MSVELLEAPEVEKLAPITKVETEIARMRKEYAGLTISGVADKEGFAKVVSARKDVKAVRVQVEKERKALVDDAVKWQRQVNEAAKGITTKLVEIEEPLQKLEDDYLAEKEHIKQEAERQRKEKIQNRCQVISSVSGTMFDGIAYTLGKFKLELATIETLSDEDFQTNVEALEAEYQIILEENQETERLAKEESDRLEAQRKELEDAANELKRQRDELEAERTKLANEKAAATPDVAAVEPGYVSSGPSFPTSFKPVVPEINSTPAETVVASKASKSTSAKVNQALINDKDQFNEMKERINEIIDSFTFKTAEGIEAFSEFEAGLAQLFANNPLIKAE